MFYPALCIAVPVPNAFYFQERVKKGVVIIAYFVEIFTLSI